MKQKFEVLRTRSACLAARASAGVAAGSILLVGTAHAALPTGATTAYDAIQTDALALIDLIWPAVIAITSGFVVLKLFKRGANKIG